MAVATQEAIRIEWTTYQNFRIMYNDEIFESCTTTSTTMDQCRRGAATAGTRIWMNGDGNVVQTKNEAVRLKVNKRQGQGPQQAAQDIQPQNVGKDSVRSFQVRWALHFVSFTYLIGQGCPIHRHLCLQCCPSSASARLWARPLETRRAVEGSD
jgi:hypothetical protein